MKVKLKVNTVTNDGSYLPGDVIELSDASGSRFVAAGYGEPVEVPQEPPKANGTQEQPAPSETAAAAPAPSTETATKKTKPKPKVKADAQLQA